MKTFIIEHPTRGQIEISGNAIQVDGMGTRIVADDGSIAFTSPHQLEVYEKPEAAPTETQE